LLWFGKLPNAAELKDTSAKLAAESAVPQPVLDLMSTFPKKALPMEVLRTSVSSLSMYDPEAEDMSPEANLRKAIRLTARCGTLITAFQQIRSGKSPIAPDPELSYSANFYYMLTGKTPNDTV